MKNGYTDNTKIQIGNFFNPSQEIEPSGNYNNSSSSDFLDIRPDTFAVFANRNIEPAE